MLSPKFEPKIEMQQFGRNLMLFSNIEIISAIHDINADVYRRYLTEANHWQLGPYDTVLYTLFGTIDKISTVSSIKHDRYTMEILFYKDLSKATSVIQNILKGFVFSLIKQIYVEVVRDRTRISFTTGLYDEAEYNNLVPILPNLFDLPGNNQTEVINFPLTNIGKEILNKTGNEQYKRLFTKISLLESTLNAKIYSDSFYIYLSPVFVKENGFLENFQDQIIKLLRMYVYPNIVLGKVRNI